MSDDTYRELREYQRNQISKRERLEKRKRGVEDLLKSTGIEAPLKQIKTEDGPLGLRKNPEVEKVPGPVTDPELESALLWYLGDISLDYPIDAGKLPGRLAKLGYRETISDVALDELLDKLALQKLIDLVDEDGTAILSPLASGKSFRLLTVASARAEKISDLHSTLFPHLNQRWNRQDGSNTIAPPSQSSMVLPKLESGPNVASTSASSNHSKLSPVVAPGFINATTGSGSVEVVKSEIMDSVSTAGRTASGSQSAVSADATNHAGKILSNNEAFESSMKATSDIPSCYMNEGTTIISEQNLESLISSRSAASSAAAATASDTSKVPPSTINGVGTLKKPSINTSAAGVGKTDPAGGGGPDSLESLLSLPSAKEKQSKKLGGEILDLLSRPTAKERSLVEKFRSADGSQLREFCPHGTKDDCAGQPGRAQKHCNRLHFRKIIQKHTDMSLGDCSFLNTCFHMNTCKYIHYEVDCSDLKRMDEELSRGALGVGSLLDGREGMVETHKLYPQQWIQCDLRKLDLDILGKFSVIMADPPWDIHMELPYGTMSDDEMRSLDIKLLQDAGLLFLWVTGRAMELGRECLKIWGYEQCDEIIWVKTNQLQRIIRTGRTGHWLNHGKEHCLVGYKGSLDIYNRGLDCDVIVGEVRETSHKPDEIYGLIERLSPGTRKLELFGRMHNAQKNWITLGNQLDGVRLLDPEVVARFKERYPDGNSMSKPKPK